MSHIYILRHSVLEEIKIIKLLKKTVLFIKVASQDVICYEIKNL